MRVNGTFEAFVKALSSKAKLDDEGDADVKAHIELELPVAEKTARKEFGEAFAFLTSVTTKKLIVSPGREAQAVKKITPSKALTFEKHSVTFGASEVVAFPELRELRPQDDDTIIATVRVPLEPAEFKRLAGIAGQMIDVTFEPMQRELPMDSAAH